MSRQTISILVMAAAAVFLLVLAPEVFMILVAGILLAVFLSGGGHAIARRLHIADHWGIAIFILAVVVVLVAFAAILAPEVSNQIDELTRRIPEAFEDFRDRIEQYAWGDRLLRNLTPESLTSGDGPQAAMSALTGTFGVLGNFVIIFFIGLYGALDPRLYSTGARLLLAPSIRGRGEVVLSAVGNTLKQWLAAQLIAMTVVGVLTSFGLWLAGVPLAFALGFIAGVLAFVPNIGPVLAIAPALLLAIPEGQTTILVVLAVYLGVQALESYVITPLIQQERVSLPPALVIAVQLLFGVLFGLLGLALATPIAAAAMTLVRMVYIEDYLEREKA
ncbi:AI-2E family transporter [Mesorhizobium sp. CAU 1741]|uniref:AI-2E family transporter n=1 Tax=Mesorhizobium sp. CAU 1741 TaxID=3140366 RepID=UPI00325A4E36